MKEKKCNKCFKLKQLSEFSLSTHSKDGRQYTCKMCKKEWHKKRLSIALSSQILYPSSFSKVCLLCKKTKSSELFHKRKDSKDGRSPVCSVCANERCKRYKLSDPDKHKKNRNQWYKKNKEKINEARRDRSKSDDFKANKTKWRLDYEARMKKKHTEMYYDEIEISNRVKKCTNCNSKKHYSEFHRNRSNSDGYFTWCKDCICSRQNEYYYKNHSKMRERLNKYSRETSSIRRSSDPLHKLKCNLRTRIWNAFNNGGYTKKSRSEKILGASWEVVKKHIERQFLPGMSWANYGEWHADHIIPLSNAKTEKEITKLCHYRNLQPLWAKDNIVKGAKIVEPVQTYLPL